MNQEKQQPRVREAVKRSVHFVLPNDFAKALEKAVVKMTQEFWSFFDNKTDVRKRVRNALWNVWGKAGADTLSVSFTHKTLLVVTKEAGNVLLELKESAGKLTELKRVMASPPVGDEQDDPINIQMFEQVWALFNQQAGTYPSSERPITGPVSQVVSGRYKAPLPVVLFGLTTRFPPSVLSNGLIEMARNTMAGETFPEDLVNSARDAGEVERIDHWSFKVKKTHYQNWRLRVTSSPIILKSF
jgi:hypothetical protein